MMNSNSKSTEATLQVLVREVCELQSQEFLEKQYDMKNHLKQTDDKMVRLRSENKELQRTVQELRNTTAENLEAINYIEQYGRRQCLETKGRAWSQHENTDGLVVAMAKNLNVSN